MNTGRSSPRPCENARMNASKKSFVNRYSLSHQRTDSGGSDLPWYGASGASSRKWRVTSGSSSRWRHCRLSDEAVCWSTRGMP
jgi:hypothetical protein